MGEKVWSAVLERSEPFPFLHCMTSKPFVFTTQPTREELVDRAKLVAKLRQIKPPVVVDPSSQNRTNPLDDGVQIQITVPMQSPGAHTSSHFDGSFLADRRYEADEVLSTAVDR
jgi:hypothetical protein